MNRQIKDFPFMRELTNFACSTPCEGRKENEQLSYSWPSPISSHEELEKQSIAKEKVHKWLENQKYTSQQSDHTSKKFIPERVVKMVVVPSDEDTGEVFFGKKSMQNTVNHQRFKAEKMAKAKEVEGKKEDLKQQKRAITEGEEQGKVVSFAKHKKSKLSVLMEKQQKKRTSAKACKSSKMKSGKEDSNQTNTAREQLNTLIEQNNACELRQKEADICKEIYSNDPGQKEQAIDMHEAAAREKRQDEQSNREQNSITEQKRKMCNSRKSKAKKQEFSEQDNVRGNSCAVDTVTEAKNRENALPEKELPAVIQFTEATREQIVPDILEGIQQIEDGNAEKDCNISTRSKKRSLFSHEKTLFSTAQVSIRSGSSTNPLFNYPFIDDTTTNECKSRSSTGRKVLGQTHKSAAKRKIQNKGKGAAKNNRSCSKPVKEVPLCLRRSSRTRVKPLAYWEGERLSYRLGPNNCFEIVGIEPGCPEKPRDHQKKHQKWEHITFRLPLEDVESPELKMVQIDKGENVQEVECFSTMRPLPSNSENDEMGLSTYVTLDGAVAQTGYMKMAPLFQTSFQALQKHYIFSILKGLAVVTIHNKTQEVKVGESFQVPKGVHYSVKNLSPKEMVLSFVMIK